MNRKTPLSDLSHREIRRHAVQGTDGAWFLDFGDHSRFPPGLHRIEGVFAVDVTNAIRYENKRSWKLLDDHAFIRT